MTFHQEGDELPWEARQNATAYFRFYPKSAGFNVTAESSPAPTFTVHDPDGTQIQSGTCTITNSGTPTISQLLITVSPIATLGERYSVRITWQVDEAIDTHFDVRTFDVVLVPFGQPTVSLNDLREERPDIDVILDRLGVRLGYTTGSTAQETMASIYAIRGLVALEGMIRTTVANDARGAVATYTGRTRSDTRYTRPRLILDRQRLNRVERLLTLREIFRGIAQDPDQGEDENSRLFQHYNREAAAVFEQLGPLQYDSNEDLVPETEVMPTRRAIFTRRVQG